MKEAIFNIGKINYLLTIIFGKTRKIETIVKENKETDEQTRIPSNLMITLGKNVVIITKPLIENGFERKPYIVKGWKQFHNQDTNIKGAKFYMDNERHSWIYYNVPDGEWISYSYENSDYNYHLEFANR